MKKLWKFLGLTALAAALVPYRVKKDEETGEKSYDALLWHARAKGDKFDGEEGRKVDVTFGLKTPEEKDWADEDLDDSALEWDELDEEVLDEDQPAGIEIDITIEKEDLADLDPETPEA